eukprot:SAG11_NODE_870_length_6811_cov_36.099508_2_plen_348_part_00
MVASREAVNGAMVRCRSIQRQLKQALQYHPWDAPCVHLSQESRSDLQWWVETVSAPTACEMKMLHHEVVIDVDSSPWAWGAFCQDVPAGGLFTIPECRRSQNAREMTGLVYAVQHFLPRLRGKCCLVQTDNTTVMCYVNRQGGRSSLLSRVSEALWKLCNQHGVTLRCVHIAGKQNVRADRVSRIRVDRGESQLNPRYLPWLDKLWGRHTVDVFAGRHNRLVDRYFSIRPEPEAAATDAFRQDLTKEANPYLNPPFGLLPRVLQLVADQQVEVTLIAPVWGASWWPQLMQMCVGPPRLLPAVPDLFLVKGAPTPQPRWRTAAFRLRGCLAQTLRPEIHQQPVPLRRP